jgi:hypothetical protein
MGDELYPVLDFILNKATDAEIEVLLNAVKRRYERVKEKGAMGISMGSVARETASRVRQQVGFSIDAVRDQVREYVTEIIRKNAPELGEDEIKLLLAEWVPRQDEMKETETRLPGDALINMVRQFIEFSTGSLTATEQISLAEAIPDWTTRYWKSFPAEVRRLIRLYLKGFIDLEACWNDIKGILLPASGSEAKPGSGPEREG